jgi:hypothetical protein
VDKDDALSNGKAIIEVLYLEALSTRLGQLVVEKQKYLLEHTNAPPDQDDWLIIQEAEIAELRKKITETIKHIESIARAKATNRRQSWWSWIWGKEEADV